MNNKKKYTRIILAYLITLITMNISAMENAEEHNLSLTITDSESHTFLEKNQHDSQSEDCKANTTKPKNNSIEIAIAIDDNDLARLEQLIDPTAINECDENGTTMLHYAALRKKTKIIKFLVQKGAKIDIQKIDGLTPCMVAACCDDLPSLNFLLDAGANPSLEDVDGYTALDYAAFNRNTDMVVKIIAQVGPSYYRNNVNPICSRTKKTQR
jgi:ankyrin repeat protein